MFENLFREILSHEHELLRAAHLIVWDGFHRALSIHYRPFERHGMSIQLMVGTHNLLSRIL
jgi:hypothetical protein